MPTNPLDQHSHDHGTTSARIFWVCFSLLVLLTILLLFSFPHSIVDDAYIFGRYALNLAEHGELNWNIGEDPVEGYTGVLLPLLYALFLLVDLPLESAGVAIGIISYFCSGLVILLHSARYENPIKVTMILLYCGMPFLYRHVFSGMETYLFILLLTCTYFLFSQVLLKKTIALILFPIATLLLSITRPEGFIFAGFSILSAGIYHIAGQTRLPKTYVYSVLAFFVLPILGYFSWRWVYYGYPLPNTFYAKYSSSWLAVSKQQILEFWLNSSLTVPLGIWVFLISLSYAASQSQLHPRQIQERKIGQALWMIMPFILPSLIIMLIYARSSLSMNFSFRYLAPFYPLAILILGYLSNLLISKIASYKTRIFFGALFVTTSIIPWFFTYSSDLSIERQEAERAWRLMCTEHIAIGKNLAAHIPANETLVVIQDAGAIPYYSGLRTIDLGGLNDEFMSQVDHDDNLLNDYIYNNHPGVFVITSYSPECIDRTISGGNQHFIDAITQDPRFEEFQIVEIYAPPLADMAYYEFVYVRQDLVPAYRGNGP